MSVCGPLDIDRNVSIRISAALVTSRPVRPTPSITAARADPVLSYASRMRAMMNTS